ncbi:MAG: NADPH:quinone reductase [Pirellulaceae bacterium]|nr:NADPH:quinone reductase [Pirellulaceae bacterium]
MPQQRKAVYFEKPGPPSTLIYGDLPIPDLAPGEVLVKTEAVSLNPIDTYLRAGADFWDLPKPFIVGSDIAGTVEKIGGEVTTLKVGDRVWGTNQGLCGRQGVFADRVAVAEDWLYLIPDGVDFEEVAALALVGVTAHLGLFQEGDLKEGETLFLQGGSGGVGSTVLQMAKIAGATVFTTASSDEKAALCYELGADKVVNYKTDDVLTEAKKFSPAGFDLFWETGREPNFDQIVDLLARRGRLILMAGRDARPEFPVGPFYVKGCSIHSFVMFDTTPKQLRDCSVDINRWLASGQLKANIAQRFPLSQAAEAHTLQEANTLELSGTLHGKIVLYPDGNR